jgi:GTP-binding protein
MIEAEETRKFFAQPCDFVLAATEPAHFPQDGARLPEIALIGRSNVGKSSLINAITGRKNLARASVTPGRTQQIVFFDLAHRLMLVDLPGYGFAKAPTENQNQWNNLVRVYIRKREVLRLVCLLIDSRHGLMANDIEMMSFLNKAAISYQVILTKADQIKTIERDERKRQIEALLKREPAARPVVIATSAEKKSGVDEVQQVLASFANPAA